jgi:hypothetical protein
MCEPPFHLDIPSSRETIFFELVENMLESGESSESLIEMANSLDEEMFAFLEQLKATLQPSGSLSDEKFWATLKLLYPRSLAVKEHIKKLEQDCYQGTWDGLDVWIAAVRKQHQDRLKLIEHALGMTASGALQNLQQLRLGPLMQQTKRLCGPNWKLSLAGLNRMWGFSGGQNLISPDMLSRHICDYADNVLKSWEYLKHANVSGKPDQFRTGWRNLSMSARQTLLRRWHVTEDKVSDAYIQEIAKRQESDWKNIPRKVFKAPLLNVDDLAHSDNLPCLLESRILYHPRQFLPLDGRGVTTGLFCGSLPELRCESRLSLTSEDEKYVFKWSATAPYNPAIIFHQLEAQVEIYRFFCACVEDCNLPANIFGSERQVEALPSSLLSQMVHIDYITSNRIDLALILDLLNCSLEDAQDDLYALRTDAELWAVRLTAQPQGRRSASFLRRVFDRIDRFDRLRALVYKLSSEGLSGSISKLVEIDEFKGYVTLEVILQSTLDEVASTLSKGKWSRRLSSETLSGLLSFILQENTVVWIIGHANVLRVIDRELRRHKIRESLPPDVLVTLHDLSVIAYCLRETQKSHIFRPYGQEHKLARLSQESLAKWDEEARPWHSLADDTTALMGQDLERNLDALISRTTENLQSRHGKFWGSVDASMDAASSGKPTKACVEMIKQNAPLEFASSTDDLNIPPLYDPMTEGPSETRRRISKGRGSTALLPSIEQTKSISFKQGFQSRLTFTIGYTLRTDVSDFWRDLINGKEKVKFTWAQFCVAMTGIGYTITPQGGSGYRFKYDNGSRSHTIVFHEPHGLGVQKLSMGAARKFWLARMQKHVNIEFIH